MPQSLLGEWPRWAQMWALAIALYSGCKLLTWHRMSMQHAAAWKHCAYLLAWPGMDPVEFFGDNEGAPLTNDWLQAFAKIACGMALLFGIARLIPEQHRDFAGWIGGAGIVLILHFGVLHLLWCAWQRAGVRSRALMQRPLRATSVADFWGRRWNTSFRDLTHRFVFRPLASRFGARVGVLGSFLCSGAIHDLVISIPARGGYGGPTAFFVIQGAAVLLERSEVGRASGLQSGLPGRVFAAVVLLAPLGLLFHRPFILGVIVPFMRAIGAL